MERKASGKHDGERRDNSLRGKSLERALHSDLPRTLTPYEWQEWYERHGVPPDHRQAVAPAPSSFWQRIKRLLSASGQAK